MLRKKEFWFVFFQEKIKHSVYIWFSFHLLHIFYSFLWKPASNSAPYNNLLPSRPLKVFGLTKNLNAPCYAGHSVSLFLHYLLRLCVWVTAMCLYRAWHSIILYLHRYFCTALKISVIAITINPFCYKLFNSNNVALKLHVC